MPDECSMIVVYTAYDCDLCQKNVLNYLSKNGISFCTYLYGQPMIHDPFEKISIYRVNKCKEIEQFVVNTGKEIKYPVFLQFNSDGCMNLKMQSDYGL